MPTAPNLRPGLAQIVAPGVRRILAPNPSPMTGPGTNSYLLGHGASVVLIDPGPDLAIHHDALMAALAPDEAIGTIIVTHAHLDHSAGARAMAERTDAPILAFGAATAGRSTTMTRIVAAGLEGGGEGIDHSFRPDRCLSDGEQLGFAHGMVEVVHTPGHMGGHISLAYGDVLLSGDHAMGWASSLISPPDGDMGAYLASLDRLAARRWRIMLPGHGPEVTDPAQRLGALAAHRRQREAQVLAALRAGPATAATLARDIYTETPSALLPAARRNVLAHLIDLMERNEVFPHSPLTAETVFSLFPPPK